MKRRLLLCTAVLIGLPAAAAVTLQDRNAIIETLSKQPPCCVVDGRSQAPRLLHPLKDAVIWKATTRITPTGSVVVIADDDRATLALAQRIARQFHANSVVPVRGGLLTWQEVQAASEEPGMPATFVIPTNTCEQGTPLQTLRAKRP